MGKYAFCEGELASDLKPTFEPFLFNEERHRWSQSLTGWKTFSFVDFSIRRILAQIHLHIRNTVASSPYSAPFGSVEFDEHLSPEDLFRFLFLVETSLKKKGVTKITIKDAPQCHRSEQAAVLSVVLNKLNFRIIKSETNSAISVDEVLWSDKISEAQRRRMRRCENEQLIFEKIEIAHLKRMYEFIAECRRERNAELSMTYEALEKTVRTCVNDFLLFGVFQQDKLIAASISVRVSKSIIYNFYPAHKKSADQLSPMVFLLGNLYNYCRRSGVRTIDLGASSLADGTNSSLLNFKTKVGGIPSMKLTFEKQLV